MMILPKLFDRPESASRTIFMSMPSTLSRHQFSSPRAALGCIHLAVQASGRGGRLTPYLRGVAIGNAVEVADSAVSVDLPIDRLPHVSLPADIRIGWDDGTDATLPLTIRTEAEAVALTGVGALENVSVIFRNGMVQGTALNRRNGVERPLILGRINGTLLRPVDVRFQSVHETGGAVIAFSMPVDPTDFSAEGGVLELLHAPSMIILWRTALGSVGAGEEISIIETKRRLSEAEHRLSNTLCQVETRLSQSILRQNQVLEDVVTYMLALIHDRANRAENEDDPDRKAARDLIALASTETTQATDERLAVIGPLSPFMGWGWSAAEFNRDRIELRRMRTAASVLNPRPERKVDRIALTVVEATSEALANLGVQTDGQARDLSLSLHEGTPCTALVMLDPPISVGVLSLSCTSPQDGIAVQDVRFFYVQDL